jgi:hypothetical protein
MPKPKVVHHQIEMKWIEWRRTYMRWSACGLQFTADTYLHSPDIRDVTCKQCLRHRRLTRAWARAGKERIDA